jgi:hypothetical protein
VRGVIEFELCNVRVEFFLGKLFLERLRFGFGDVGLADDHVDQLGVGDAMAGSGAVHAAHPARIQPLGFGGLPRRHRLLDRRR